MSLLWTKGAAGVHLFDPDIDSLLIFTALVSSESFPFSNQLFISLRTDYNVIHNMGAYKTYRYIHTFPP